LLALYSDANVFDGCSERKDNCHVNPLTLGEKQQQSVNIESLSTQWSGPLSYASVVMSARDAQCDRKERQQRVLFDAADGILIVIIIIAVIIHTYMQTYL